MSRGYLYNVETNEVFINNNRYAKKANNCVIIKSVQNLGERYGLKGLREICPSLGIEVQDGQTTSELSDLVWQKFKEITNEQLKYERRLKREAYRQASGEGGGDSTTSPRPGRLRSIKRYRVCIQEISDQLRPTRKSGFSHQATAILDGLRSQSSESFTESELKEFVEQLALSGRLTGRKGQPLGQPAWKVFEYYERKFHDAGLVIRTVERQYRGYGGEII